MAGGGGVKLVLLDPYPAISLVSLFGPHEGFLTH